jgi:CheY-like chemotaxis protein
MTKPELIVLDDDDVVRSIIHALAHESVPSANITDYASGFPALQQIEGGGTDLLITDCHMPDMDGPTLVKILRAKKMMVSIIMVSGSDARELGEEAGIDCFVEKQHLFSELPDAIQTLLKTA